MVSAHAHQGKSVVLRSQTKCQIENTFKPGLVKDVVLLHNKLRTIVAQSRDCAATYSAQSQDSENAQRNLEIARNIYTY